MKYVLTQREWVQGLGLGGLDDLPGLFNNLLELLNNLPGLQNNLPGLLARDQMAWKNAYGTGGRCNETDVDAYVLYGWPLTSTGMSTNPVNFGRCFFGTPSTCPLVSRLTDKAFEQKSSKKTCRKNFDNHF